MGIMSISAYLCEMPTGRKDNERGPENSTLDWLNLNALGSRAIQGAIDRMRTSTLGGTAGEAEARMTIE